MDLKFKVAGIKVQIKEVNVELGEMSYELTGLDFREVFDVAQALPGFITDVKSAVNDEYVPSTDGLDRDGDSAEYDFEEDDESVLDDDDFVEPETLGEKVERLFPEVKNAQPTEHRKDFYPAEYDPSKLYPVAHPSVADQPDVDDDDTD